MNERQSKRKEITKVKINEIQETNDREINKAKSCFSNKISLILLNI